MLLSTKKAFCQLESSFSSKMGFSDNDLTFGIYINLVTKKAEPNHKLGSASDSDDLEMTELS